MHHEMQELGHLRLELVRLGPIGSGCFLCGLGHDVLVESGRDRHAISGLLAAQVKGTKKAAGSRTRPQTQNASLTEMG